MSWVICKKGETSCGAVKLM